MAIAVCPVMVDLHPVSEASRPNMVNTGVEVPVGTTSRMV